MTILYAVKKNDHVDFGRYYLLSYTRVFCIAVSANDDFSLRSMNILILKNVICILNKRFSYYVAYIPDEWRVFVWLVM